MSLPPGSSPSADPGRQGTDPRCTRPGVLRGWTAGPRAICGPLLPRPRRSGRTSPSPRGGAGHPRPGPAPRATWPFGSSPGSSTASPSTTCASRTHEVTAALAAIPAELRAALRGGPRQHRRLPPHPAARRHGRLDRDGVVVRDLTVPVDRAGLYVPGGRAPLASTVLMTAGPGPGGRRGRTGPVLPARARTAAWPPPILAAAAIAGVDEVYRIGGAQAIAALAYGTETRPGGRRHRRSRQPLRGHRRTGGRRRGSGRRALGLRRARPRSSSWPTPRRRSPTPPSIWSSRPSTAPTGWPS